MTEATATGSEATSTGTVATATVAEFTLTGSKFASTGCYVDAFKTVANNLINVGAANRNE